MVDIVVTNEDTEAQEGEATCPRFRSWSVGEHRATPRPSDTVQDVVHHTTTSGACPGLYQCTLTCFSKGGVPFQAQERMQMNLMSSSCLL